MAKEIIRDVANGTIDPTETCQQKMSFFLKCAKQTLPSILSSANGTKVNNSLLLGVLRINLPSLLSIK